MTNIKALEHAAEAAQNLLREDSPMLYDIMKKNDWKYSSGDGYHIATCLRAYPFNVNILTYRPFNPFTRAIAMTNGDGAIHFNIYKVHKSKLSDMVGTILHEYSHLCNFKHGNNFKTKHKCEFSVPYWLSSNVERWL